MDSDDIKIIRALGEIAKKIIPPFCNSHSVAIKIKSELAERGMRIVKVEKKRKLDHADVSAPADVGDSHQAEWSKGHV